MKKVIIIVLILAVIGGGVFFYLQSKKTKEDSTEKETTKTWNTYSKEDSHLITLNDRMTSVAGGAHIAKFTVTLKLKNEQAYEKFQGYDKPLTEKERSAEGEGHSSSEDEEVSPMNVKIYSLISRFMSKLGEEESKDVETIEGSMKNYLNEHLGMDDDFIEEVYIEQYIFN